MKFRILLTIFLGAALVSGAAGCWFGQSNHSDALSEATASNPTEDFPPDPALNLPPTDPTRRASTPEEGAEPKGAETPTALVGNAIAPPQAAVLQAQQANAQINLRSQPNAASEAKGYGLVGDRVQLQRSVEATDGYTWYYVKFAESGAEGWIRGDLVDRNAPAAIPTATTQDAVGEAVDAVCGGSEKINAAFSTQNYNVYICNPGRGLVYIGSENGTNQTLVTEDVRSEGNQYIAVNGNFEYRVDSTDLVVYRIDDNGNYIQVLQEAVVTSQQY